MCIKCRGKKYSNVTVEKVPGDTGLRVFPLRCLSHEQLAAAGLTWAARIVQHMLS